MRYFCRFETLVEDAAQCDVPSCRMGYIGGGLCRTLRTTAWRHLMNPFPLSAGRPYPLGATFDGEGVNFAVFSQHATRVVLSLCDGDGNETYLVDLAERDGHVWHGYLS